MTNFQDLVAKVKNLGALAPVLGTISRPARVRQSETRNDKINAKSPKILKSDALLQQTCL